VLPFCMKQKGHLLREALKASHAQAEGSCYVDVAFHLIIADPTEQVLGQEPPALIEDGYTSFKVFMTYEGLALSDREMLEVMAVARDRHGHAENYDAIRFLLALGTMAGALMPLVAGRVFAAAGVAGMFILMAGMYVIFALAIQFVPETFENPWRAAKPPTTNLHLLRPPHEPARLSLRPL
jgi:dihydroorotase-like cyclic amidohydrolase